MKKGIVIDVSTRYVTLLTPEGEFCKQKKQRTNYDLGEEMTFTEGTGRKNQSVIIKAPAILVSIAAVFLLAFAILPSMFGNHVSAYVSVDINPSVELGVDDHTEVISIKGINQDGEYIKGQMTNWKHKNVAEVADQIVLLSDKAGFLQDEQTIFISTVLVDDQDLVYQKTLQNSLATINAQSTKKAITIQSNTATVEDRQKAMKKGVSTGKYKQDHQQEIKAKKKPASQSTSTNKQPVKELPVKGSTSNKGKKDQTDEKTVPSKNRQSAEKEQRNNFQKWKNINRNDVKFDKLIDDSFLNIPPKNQLIKQNNDSSNRKNNESKVRKENSKSSRSTNKNNIEKNKRNENRLKNQTENDEKDKNKNQSKNQNNNQNKNQNNNQNKNQNKYQNKDQNKYQDMKQKQNQSRSKHQNKERK